VTNSDKAILYRIRQLLAMPHKQKYAIAMELGIETVEKVTVDDLERYLLRYDNQQARRHGLDVATVTAERHEFEASQI
tara:strand:- start:165 stop:398 length:234 start_codon:yes stop_codon:yes gene_type:complete